ncbi:MAG: FHA domain-containing protein, partial [Nocardioides sp.]|nr:FHA domain-containing protein [Nocardioides sp.]
MSSRLRITVRGESREYADPVVAVGRDDQVGVTVPHPDVSRRHAEFRRTPHGWYLVDLRSTNGTWVDGQRISHELLAADRQLTVVVGGENGEQFQVEVLPAAVPEASPPPNGPASGTSFPQEVGQQSGHSQPQPFPQGWTGSEQSAPM